MRLSLRTYPPTKAGIKPKIRSAQRTRYHANDAGFSLLEIMTVLIIIGLMSAAVVLSLKGPKDAPEDIANRFAAGINQFAKDAIYTGRPNALSVSKEGLHLMLSLIHISEPTRPY